MRRTVATLLAVTIFAYAASVSLAQEDAASPRADAARITALEAAIQKLLTENNNLKKEVKRLSKAIDDLSTRHGNNYVPKIFANMNVDREFRTEVMRTNQGRLVLNNKMGRTITYYINGARWRIPRGRHSIPVPLGTVIVHTVGEIAQPLNDWELGVSGKHYEIRRSIQSANSVPRGY